jgi:hypothetical protein
MAFPSGEVSDGPGVGHFKSGNDLPFLASLARKGGAKPAG